MSPFPSAAMHSRIAVSDLSSIARSIMGSSRKLMSQLDPDQALPHPMAEIQIPPLQLPLPNDLLDLLRSYDLPAPLTREFSRIILNASDELQSTCHRQYQQTCQSLAKLPSSDSIDYYLGEINKTYYSLYTGRYVPWIRTQIISQLESREATTSNKTKRTPFNAEYIPVLAKYFEYNAYPSAPDRLVLARKSMMTPRQIEVWFQNHRKRARREGRVPRRLSTHPLPQQLSLTSLQNIMPAYSVPGPKPGIQHPPLIASSIIQDKAPSSKTQVDLLNPPRPEHAFPTPYSSQLQPEPFNGQFKFGPITWFRKPARIPTTLPKVDINQLIIDFSAKLHVRDGKPNKQSIESRIEALKLGIPQNPWYADRITIPPVAPHYSLIPARDNTKLSLCCSESVQGSGSPARVPRHKSNPKLKSFSSLSRWDPHLLDAPSQPFQSPSRTPSSSSLSSGSGSSSSGSDLETPPSSPTVMFAKLTPPIFDFPNEHCFMHDLQDTF